MVTATILEVVQDGETLITVVEYDYDGKKVAVKIPHFQPQDKAAVMLGIHNRAASEERTLTAADLIAKVIAPDVSLEIGRPFEIGGK